jgi:hypothetical protein
MAAILDTGRRYYGIFMNFELLPILTDYEIKKKGG